MSTMHTTAPMALLRGGHTTMEAILLRTLLPMTPSSALLPSVVNSSLVSTAHRTASSPTLRLSVSRLSLSLPSSCR